MDNQQGMAWSRDGQVFYEGNNAWGVTPTLKTIWLGTRADVERRHPIATLEERRDEKRKPYTRRHHRR